MPTPTESTDAQLGPTDVARAVVYGLIGVGASVVASAPKAVKQARSDLVAARFIGEMAVTQGASQLRGRLGRDDEPGTAAPAATQAATRPDPEPSAVDDDNVEPDEIEVAGNGSDDLPVPSVDELAIPDYDTVPAIDVVMQLADLDADERSRIEAYELANRGRRTILGKVDQLRGAG